ncbi:hypothetical protein GGS23DRAFT_359852 [Durotheca rogersii]|uniref:uncharacterized protein n=1 Tax=Durotheca rogersii TaxID=419775 RepID=UPI002220FB87|nr:uncharacterized protein GGS23DRAFT_359852 [Durotheca rogersii]KAI5865916.1 hypothetical protein GGS23DRAFT_359852 [Durotheca rogersii]
MALSRSKFPIKGGTYPPYGVITDDNHGSYVVIATWVFACISVLFVAVRVALRTWTSSYFGWDNGLIVAALAVAIGQSISATESVKYGSGRHRDALDQDQIRSYFQAIFASEILSVFIFVLSKLSLAALISHITPSNIIKTALRWFAVFTGLWGISDVLSISFQCGARVPMRIFDISACVDERSLLFAHGIINIATDFFLAVFPALIVWKVQMRKQKILIVLGLFWARLAVCATAGVQLSTTKHYFSGDDPTWDYLYPSLWNQITTHLSIITACIPSIKPFFDSLQSSLIDSGIPRNYTSNNRRIELRPWGTSNKSSSGPSQKFEPSLRGIGLSTTTYNEIEGGVNSDYASTRELTASVIHQQRDVDVVVADASEVFGTPGPTGNTRLLP